MVVTFNRADEWKIEQGLHAAKLPILDQTGAAATLIPPQVFGELKKDEAAIEAVGNRDMLFAKEIDGWKG